MSFAELSILLLLLAFTMMLVGVLLIVLGALREAVKTRVEGKTEAGGVVVVGPVPIVFGTSARITKVLLVLAIALTLVVLFTYLVLVGAFKWWS